VTEQPTTEQPRTDAEIIREAHQRWGASSAGEHGGQTLWEAIAAALAAAGRLLPEGWTVREQFGVRGDDPTFKRPVTMPKATREEAEALIADEGGPGKYNLHVVHRVISDWQPVSINEERQLPACCVTSTAAATASPMTCVCGLRWTRQPQGRWMASEPPLRSINEESTDGRERSHNKDASKGEA
jgi:hypothetical protein